MSQVKDANALKEDCGCQIKPEGDAFANTRARAPACAPRSPSSSNIDWRSARPRLFLSSLLTNKLVFSVPYFKTWNKQQQGSFFPVSSLFKSALKESSTSYFGVQSMQFNVVQTKYPGIAIVSSCRSNSTAHTHAHTHTSSPCPLPLNVAPTNFPSYVASRVDIECVVLSKSRC